MTRSIIAVTLVSLSLLISTGCASSTPAVETCPPPGCEPDPVVAVERYRDLLVASRPRDAFTWLHPDATEGLDADAFALLFERHGEALVAQAEDLVLQARAGAPTLVARVRTDHGDVLVQRTPEGWRLENPAPSVAPLKSP